MDQSGEYRATNFIAKPITLDMMKSTLGEKVQTSEKKTRNFPPLSVKNTKTHTRFDYEIEEPSYSEKKTVLLVDDDSFNRVMMAKMLEMLNFSTIEAKDGQMALDVYEKHWKNIDVVLMDCEMPVMNGLEATRSILAKQQLNDGRRLPIYGVTGHVRAEYKEKCLSAGMRGVLEKPVTIEKLRDVLSGISQKALPQNYKKLSAAI